MASRDQDDGAGEEYRYHGRSIRIQRPGGRARGARDAGAAADAGARSRLFIDEVEVEVEETERGILSHASAFKEYGTIEELAEDLVRQRGTRTVTAEPSRSEDAAGAGPGQAGEAAADDRPAGKGSGRKPGRRRQQR